MGAVARFLKSQAFAIAILASAAISFAASARAKTVGRISTPVKISLGSSGAVAGSPETPAAVSTTAAPSR